jgi:hypothetical protein
MDEEVYKTVNMTDEEIKMVLTLIYTQHNKDGFYNTKPIKEWARIVGGLPWHLQEMLDK